jgi:hypothetical protein
MDADTEAAAAADAAAIAVGSAPLRLAVQSDPDHVGTRIAAHQRARAARAEAAKRLVDYEALKECTFQPETQASARSHARIKGQVAADGGVVVVRGLGRYLELKELKRKLEEERAEREREAFSIAPDFVWPEAGPKPPTVPQPFQLSSADTAAAHAARRTSIGGAAVAPTAAADRAAQEAADEAEERRIAAARVASGLSASASAYSSAAAAAPAQRRTAAAPARLASAAPAPPQRLRAQARGGPMHPSQRHALLLQAVNSDGLASPTRPEASAFGGELNLTRM